MKKASLIIIGLLFTQSVIATDSWDLDTNFGGLAVADADWTINKVFPGTKIIFDGRYSIKRDMAKGPTQDDCCRPLEPAKRMIGIIDAHLQWGEGETGLEYAIVAVTPWAFQRNTPASEGFGPIRDTLEFGVVQGGFDDPLGIDSYSEITFVRASRTWGFKTRDESPWTFIVGLKVSFGWAWADSFMDVYKDVSNPIAGMFTYLAVEHERFGRLYTDDRIVPGFTLGSPATNASTSREARIRFGYFNNFYRCMTVDLFVEKRSFNFADPVLPDLYTKSKRSGVEIGCQF